MDSKQHAEFTGEEADISAEIGGRSQAYGDYIEAENIELAPGKKIVQKWRASDWPEDAWSTVTYELKEKDNGTELVFTQIDVPEDQSEEISQGWYDYYWDPLQEYFENN